MRVFKVKVISRPCPKVIYILNVNLNFLKNRLTNQSQILHVVSLRRVDENLYKSHRLQGHMTKMAAIPIYGKKLFFSGTNG